MWGRNVHKVEQMYIHCIIVWCVNIEDKGKDCAEQIYGLKGQCHEIFDFRFSSKPQS
jgi:hypothetical protein